MEDYIRLQSLKQRVYPWKKMIFFWGLPFLGGQTAGAWYRGEIAVRFREFFVNFTATSQLRVNGWKGLSCDSRIWGSGCQQHLVEHSRKQQKIVGGWTNPSETYDRQIESSPQGKGWKFQKCLSCHHPEKTVSFSANFRVWGFLKNHPKSSPFFHPGKENKTKLQQHQRLWELKSSKGLATL